jgi:DNA repair protein RadC
MAKLPKRPDLTGQVPYWVENPPGDIVDPDQLRPKVLTAIKGKVAPVLVNNAAVAARILRPFIANAEVEYATVMYLNTKNKLIGIEHVGKGTLDAALIHPREVFSGAIRMKAASIIKAHNHPSGDPNPSTQDDEVYRRLVAAGDVVGIKLMDDLILGRDSFYCYSAMEVVPYDS